MSNWLIYIKPVNKMFWTALNFFRYDSYVLLFKSIEKRNTKIQLFYDESLLFFVASKHQTSKSLYIYIYDEYSFVQCWSFWHCRGYIPQHNFPREIKIQTIFAVHLRKHLNKLWILGCGFWRTLNEMRLFRCHIITSTMILVINSKTEGEKRHVNNL